MNRNFFLILAVIVVFVAAAGTLIWDFVFEANDQRNHDTILGLTVFTIGISTFFGFTMAGNSTGSRWSLDRGGMRTAITAAVVVTYLFMVSFQTFLTHRGELSQMTRAYLESFTSIVGITIAFYLGGSIALQALSKDESTEKGSTQNKEENS